MVVNDNARRAQIEIGCREFERHFGRRPQGIWLPECGYIAGRRRAAARRRHPATSSSTRTASCSPSRGRKYGVYAPILCPEQRRRRPGPRHRVVQAGLERRRGLPRRLQLPRLLPRRRLRPRLRLPQAAPAPDRHPQPARHQVLQDHRPRPTTSSPTTRRRRWTRPPSTPATSCSTARSRSNGWPARWTAGRR